MPNIQQIHLTFVSPHTAGTYFGEECKSSQSDVYTPRLNFHVMDHTGQVYEDSNDPEKIENGWTARWVKVPLTGNFPTNSLEETRLEDHDHGRSYLVVVT